RGTDTEGRWQSLNGVVEWLISQELRAGETGRPPTFGELEPDLRQIVPRLIKRLRHHTEILGRPPGEDSDDNPLRSHGKNENRRTVTIRALGTLGPLARDALPALEKVLDNAWDAAQLAAARAAIKRIKSAAGGGGDKLKK